MKSDSTLMNELAHKTNYLRQLTAEESAGMKKALLDIYKDVAALCDKYGLVYMMSGGTCLGTVRHQGFIPWDDDLDIMMPRKDYDRLIELLAKGELGDKYEYDAPNAETDAKTIFLKIYRSNSLNVDVYSEGAPFPQGLYIDVFALDSCPKTKFGQKIKGLFANGLQFIAILRLYSQFQCKTMQEFMALDEGLNRRYKLKVFLGKMFGFAPHRKWVYWFDKFVSSSKPGCPVGIPTGRKYYTGEIFPADVYFPPQKGVFEGIEVNIPANYDAYLTNLYHDYMKLPPEDKRERHFICEFKLPDE